MRANQGQYSTLFGEAAQAAKADPASAARSCVAGRVRAGWDLRNSS